MEILTGTNPSNTQSSGTRDNRWYVYMTDHHEGPFTPTKLREMLVAGKITTATYVWCQGMADWEIITQVSDLASIHTTHAKQPAAEPAQPVQSHVATPIEPVAIEPMALEATPAEPAVTISTAEPIQPVAVATAEPVATEEATGLQPVLHEATPAGGTPNIQIQEEAPRITLTALGSENAFDQKPAAAPAPARKKRTGLWLAFVVLALALGGGALVYRSGAVNPETIRRQLAPLAEKIPGVGAWLSPIPVLTDVRPEEYEDLKAAANADPAKAGGRLALALAQGGDPATTKIYVASNLPDGTQIQLTFSGLSDTLLGELSAEAKATVTIDHHLGTLTDVREADNKPLSRGQYRVFAFEAENQPNAAAKAMIATLPPTAAGVPADVPRTVRTFSSRAYFLGGPRDSTYTSRLKEYHDRLREKASAELIELDQIAQTLDQALASSVEQFKSGSRGKVTPPKKAAWQKFSAHWSEMMQQIGGMMKAWTPETLQNDKFYGSVYAKSIEAQQAVAKVHEFHDGFFAGTTDGAAIDIRAGEAAAQAQATINEFKAKIDQVRSIPPSPNGMPGRPTGGEQ